MDEIVLKKAISGDKNAFSQIYQELFDGLWRYVFSRLGEKEVASDVVSESFLALFENIKSIRHWRAVKTYLYRIVKSKMIKFYGEEKTIPFSHEEFDRVSNSKVQVGPVLRTPVRGGEGGGLEPTSKQADFSPASREKNLPTAPTVNVEDILAKLPENYQEVLRLRFLSGLKIREVAEIMDKSEGNVKVLQNRAIKKARRLFENKMEAK